MSLAAVPQQIAAGQNVAPATAQQAPPPRVRQASPEQQASEQDHQIMMDLLHIKSLRPGADPNHPDAPNAVNYDEAKANPYPNLPDPLVLNNGKKVTTAANWWKLRRPQIVEAFDKEVYGRVPKLVPAVHWQVASVTHSVDGEVPIVTRELVGHVANSAFPSVTVDIKLALTTPANATGPVPVMMEFGFDPAFFARLRAQMLARGIKPPPPPPGPTWQEQVLARGWGYAILIPTSFQADNGAGLTQGIIGLCNHSKPRKPDDWGTLRAWAWGASRALDYFETDKSVDAKQVGIEGLSRYGKAALVTMAYDRRFAIALVGSSGKGGAALFRRNFGEEVENLAGTGEYHWMAGNFLKYAGPLWPNDLPVDSHEMIALCAPRPVFISYGNPKVEGGWVDLKGSFMAAVAAGPVYGLLGKRGLEDTNLPPMGTSLLAGDIGFREHEGGHTDFPNWPAFLDFASRYIKGPAVEAAQKTDDGAVAANLTLSLTLTR